MNPVAQVASALDPTRPAAAPYRMGDGVWRHPVGIPAAGPCVRYGDLRSDGCLLSYRLTWQEAENRPSFLMLAGLMFCLYEVLQPDAAMYYPHGPPAVSFASVAFRVLFEVAVLYVASVGITLFRKRWPRWPRFQNRPASAD